MDDDLIIRVGNDIRSPNAPGRAAVFELRGWQAVRVQRSCEVFPSVFEIAATERYPGGNIDAPVTPGDPCTVLFTRGYGRDTVMTGYVDSVAPQLGASRHEIRIVGRGKGQDLVDCSQTRPTGQFNNMSVLAIARALAEPFGIAVESDAPAARKIIPQLVANWLETPYELIERVARFAGLLVYEDEAGNVILSRVGEAKMATGAVEGKNVVRASVSYTMSERHSEYRVRRLTFSPFRDSGADPEGDIVAVIPDGGVPRFRPKTIIAETPFGMGLDYALARGQWEAARRFGRSTQIRLTVDSWRDGAGTLWAPNTEIPVELPTLKIPAGSSTTWVIASVIFRRDERGTEADLAIMPAGAFDVLPLPITPPLNAGPF